MTEFPPQPRTPMQAAIARLQDYLASQRLLPQARLPSGRALAARCGVDFSTMNRAIRELSLRGLLRREGYRLFLARPPGIEVVPPTLHVLAPHPRIAAGAEERIGPQKGRVIQVPWHWASYVGELRRLQREGSRGLIVWTHRTPVDAALAAFARHAPVVAIGHGSEAVPSVSVDWERACALAVAHLRDLGHREVACLTRPVPAGPGHIEEYRRACEAAGLPSSARRVLSVPNGPARLGQAWKAFRLQHPSITAVYVTDSATARDFVTEVGAGTTIPKELSVIAQGDEEDHAAGGPPLTAVRVDPHRLGIYAASLLLDQLAANGPGAAAERLLLPPRLQVRGSTCPPRETGMRGRPAPSGALPRPSPFVGSPPRWPASAALRRRAVDDLAREAYSLAAHTAPPAFVPLDLRARVNRSLVRYKSWLGHFPLLHLKAGRRTLHGVPFDLIDGKRNGDRAALVLGSAHAPRLPHRVRVGLKGVRAAAAYFLHGCGWATDHTKFASYRFVYEDGGEAAIDLVPYGSGPLDDALRGQWTREANIQDWWPSFDPLRNDDARPFVVAKDGDPEAYERTLYTLQWINPHPEIPLRALEIASNPEARCTLGLLAVTLAAPRDRGHDLP